MKARKTLMAVALATALAAATSVTLAHGGFGHGGMYGRMMGGPTPELAAQRLAALRDALKLQSDQWTAWKAFEATITANAAERAKLRAAMPDRADREAMADFRVTMLKFAAQTAEENVAARRTLFAALTAEQRATFDRFVPGPRHRGPGHGYRGDCPGPGGRA